MLKNTNLTRRQALAAFGSITAGLEPDAVHGHRLYQRRIVLLGRLRRH